MNVLVDTSVWSLALRRSNTDKSKESNLLKELILDSRAMIMGPIRQELLSGIAKTSHFNKLKNHLKAFPDLELTTNDFELAAEYYNNCRSKGIQGSNTDFLICSVSVNQKFSIFTVDNDFILFKEHLPIKLYAS